MDIIIELKKSKLVGRGGAAFPTWQKWEIVKSTKAKKKYIICNAAEGEPGVSKDGFILENFPKEVVGGMKLALETIDDSLAYIYLRKDYYEKFNKRLTELIDDFPIKLFKKTGGYLSGEETTMIAAIENRRLEPSIRPPFPPQAGLHGCPTLINNLETFYHTAKIAKDEYKKTRFYTISGDIENPGVYELSEDFSVEKILKETNNYPSFSFFIQSGGAMSGEILLPEELDQRVRGQGAIVVYDKEKIDPLALMKKWIEFFYRENCDKCVPCREGVYRIKEMLEKGKIDKEILDDLFFVMEETSFCALGQSVVVPFRSLISKILKE